MSIITGLLFGVTFLSGVLLVGLGVAGINNRRFIPGGALLLAGLILAIWSGQEIHQRYFLSNMQKKIQQTSLSLSRIRAERGRVDQQKQQLSDDSARLVKQLKAKVGKDGNLEALMNQDVEVRGLVDKAAQVQRWLGECDKGISELMATEKVLENNLFYMRNLDAMSQIGDEKVGTELAKDMEKKLGEQAGTPKGGTIALPVTDEEVKKIGALVNQGK